MSDHAYRSMSLERGLSILMMFSDAHPTRTISELADALELSRASAHRYVATLVEQRFIQRTPGKRSYSLGPRALLLGLTALNSMAVRRVSAPYAERLSRELGYTVTVGVLVDTALIEIEKVRTGPSVDLNIDPGMRLPVYCTAQGKVLLAALPDAERQAVVDSLDMKALTTTTVTDPQELLAELVEVRRRGYAIANEEYAYGVRSAAAPIRDASRRVIAAISINGYASQTPLPELGGMLARHLRATADAISAALGDPMREAYQHAPPLVPTASGAPDDRWSSGDGLSSPSAP